MNYQRIYDSIISRGIQLHNIRATERKTKLQYYERHHIIPKCLGGSNLKSNIVILTAREHFICHRLLCEIYPSNSKLQFALWAMCNQKSKYQNRIPVSSKIYERIKIQSAKAIGLSKLGIKLPPKSIETRRKMSAWQIGKIVSEQTRQKISSSLIGKPGTFLGRHHSEESLLKMSLAKKGKTYEEMLGAEKAKNKKIAISKSLKGKKLTPEQCKNRSLRQLGSKNHRYGKNNSEEHNLIISRANKFRYYKIKLQKNLTILNNRFKQHIFELENIL